MSDSHRTHSETKAKQNEQRFYENLASKNAQLAKKYATKDDENKRGDQ